MKKFINLFLMCFLVIVTSGVGNLQANVIEKDATYIDVGQIASVDYVVVADYDEVQFIVCNNTTLIGYYAETVTVESVKFELPVETRLLIYKVPWQFKANKIYYANNLMVTNKSPRQPRDGLVIEATVL